jgi:hypothetical protein
MTGIGLQRIDDGSRGGWRDPRWALAGLWILVALVYLPGLGGGYVFDDYSNIVHNASVHVTTHSSWGQWLAAMFSSPASELQRPLAMLSFAINHALTGLDPYWMKLTNVGIHLLNTGLVYGLAGGILQAADRRASTDDIFRRKRIALWIAAAWALNPINLMAVLFIVQRMESLSHTFVFAGLWMYMAGRMRLEAGRGGWPLLFGGLVGGTLIGTLAKESAVLLPLYALALEWSLLDFTREGKRDRRLLTSFVFLLLVPGLAGMAWKAPVLLSPGAWTWRDFGPLERLLTESRVLVDYLHWTLLPNINQLSLYHDDYAVSRGLLSPPATLFALLALGALACAAIWLRKRRPLIALGLAWFFAAHLLTATIVPLELMYEHRNYFASLGLCVALADILLRLPSTAAWHKVGTGIAFALLAFYAGLTALRANEWSTPLRFSISEAAKRPQSPRATYDVARNLLILSDYQRDSPYLEPAFAALERAMVVPGATPLPEQGAIILASRTGRPIRAAWWEQLQSKLRARPIGPQESGAMAGLVACQIQHACQLPRDQMQASFAAAFERAPSAEMRSIHGNYALNILHDPTLALREWEQAARQAPGVVRYQETLARMQIATGQLDQAAISIQNIRTLGRWGQNAPLADALDAQLSKERRELPLRARATSPR